MNEAMSGSWLGSSTSVTQDGAVNPRYHGAVNRVVDVSQTTSTGTEDDTRTGVSEATAVATKPQTPSKWSTVVWNDPVNLMSYVEWIFCHYFRFSRAVAHARMLEVHHNGRATVSTGTRTRMEADVAAMHAYGLNATLEPAGEET